jgi:hypothetical protein
MSERKGSVKIVKAMHNVKVTVRTKDGVIKQSGEHHNIVVDDGLDHLRDQVHSAETGALMDDIAIGEGQTAEAAGQSALVTEYDRAHGTYASGGSGIAEITYTFTAAGTVSIWETGLFNNPTSGGTMMARVKFGASYDLSASDELTIEWTVTYTRA